MFHELECGGRNPKWSASVILVLYNTSRLCPLNCQYVLLANLILVPTPFKLPHLRSKLEYSKIHVSYDTVLYIIL